MEFTWLLPAFIIYMVVRSIAKGAKSAAEEARREAGRRAAAGAAAGTSVGASDLMRELQKVLEESRRVAAGGVPSQPKPALPTHRPAQIVIKGEDGISLEAAIADPVSLDAEAEGIIARRRAEVEIRNAELAGEHHDRFDKRIRRAAPLKASVAVPGRRPPGGLREAMIWSEILGKPVGLR